MANGRRSASGPNWFDAWTRDVARDVTAEDLQRLFTRDTRDAYRFFTRGLDADQLARMPWHKRLVAEVRLLFFAFSMKLSPARRVVFGAALVLAFIGLINLFNGIGMIPLLHVPLIGHVWTIATHVEDVPPEEMAERFQAAMGQAGSAPTSTMGESALEASLLGSEV